MPKLAPIPANMLIKFLTKHGFQKIRQSGSHAFFKHEDGRTTVVPIHAGEDIRPALLLKILDDIRITREGFMKELGK